MKKWMSLRKKIAGLLAVGITVLGFAVSNVYAANAIDTSAKCTVSVNVADSHDKKDGDLDRAYNTMKLSSVDFSVELYKVADVSKAAAYTLTDRFCDVADVNGKEIAELSGVTTKEWIDIVEKASAVVEAAPDMEPEYTIPVHEGKGSIQDVMVGLYLVVVPDIITDTEIYTFSHYLIQLPTVEGAWKCKDNGEYVFVGSDEWIYSVALNWSAKFERTDRLTGISIQKTVDTFNQSMNQTSFVYSITAEKDYGTDPENPKMVKVFDDIRVIDFSQAGTESIIVDKIPAGSSVTVKEIYTGATYRILSDKEENKAVVKLDDLTAIVDESAYPVANFENTYDDKLIGNGTAVVNTFTKGEEGWEWSSPLKNAQQDKIENME